MSKPFTSTPTGNLKEDVNFQELSQGTIRSQGRDGQHIEGGLVLNEDGADVDFRVEADTVPNALVVDGSTGNVGVGAAPGQKLDAQGSGIVAIRAYSTAGSPTIADVQIRNANRLWRWHVNSNLGNAMALQDVTGSAAVPFQVQAGAPGNTFVIDSSGRITLGPGSPRFTGRTATAADPTTTELPSDKDFGLHKNTSSGAVFLAYNDGGVIKKVALT